MPQGRATTSSVKLTNANRNTLKKHFGALVEQDRLTMHGKGPGIWYSLR